MKMKSEMELFLKILEEKEIKTWRVEEGEKDYYVVLGMGMENTNFHLAAIFSKDEHTVALRIYDFIHVTEDQMPMALLGCNTFNKNKKWVRFYVDKDGDIVVANDMIVDELTAGEEVFELMMRMAFNADEAYKEINKVIGA